MSVFSLLVDSCFLCMFFVSWETNRILSSHFPGKNGKTVINAFKKIITVIKYLPFSKNEEIVKFKKFKLNYWPEIKINCFLYINKNIYYYALLIFLIRVKNLYSLRSPFLKKCMFWKKKLF